MTVETTPVSTAERELRTALEAGTLAEIEVAWSDAFGHAQGKRIPAKQFLRRALGSGFAFCEASLGWNSDGTVIDSLRQTNWSGGYPDVFAVPDLSTYRPLPWRPNAGHVIADIVTHHRTPSGLDPRAVLRRVIERLAALGYTAKVGVELEFYLLNPDGTPFQDDIHAYSLQNANALEPLLTDLYETLSAFTALEGIQTEYGPGQVETNLVYADALTAADDAARLKYAAKEVARRHGKLASFMAKPFSEHSGSSQHLHISLWRDGDPAFAPDNGAENPTARHAIAGLLEHLPSITLFGAHSVNAYRRFEPDSFAPATVTWSRDNRSAAIRSLVEPDPAATRIELRSGASDANPYWLIASALAAIIAGLEAKSEPPPLEGGNLYHKGVPLPESLGVAVELATRDDTITEILGADSVHDFAALARSEWTEYTAQVTDWERDRYLVSS
ncbi:glutamine synthetase, catalytic domain protein [Mycolicibacterium hassiacum DSM 44199]|jgi:glutamine synthetase|uniref:Glutamine synthetase, catalytic domain protein n=1 Tax=Mycolicibacterium hassiacum (strain DSM 44199 / CIP 105218 / JCM 12690 / 3849) TaxID=1122247 RepID=K5BEN1_MYCHD|nr:glutamine synthetase family protein [Mycolicibacterium hassiacum]EKF23147.1 glutamine synthetase, catalytic domain protein [Mycolicibacterium hassiacum DSM 44199]MBX5487533.1 glutamine synthetase [Mycolicibacterium hassiacum]MDA4085577.1 glutamine synthetase [Mycolicibacterium hassiacum DSM 44199]VCT89639.1 Glutamate--isopropylamine ligase [Mycolicibacterium hassiacum DSM 44199]